MKKFILPEKWHLKSTNSEEDIIIVKYINTTFETNITPGLGISMSEWWYTNYSIWKSLKHDSGSDSNILEKHPDSIEITYDEFITYVINNGGNRHCEHDPELEIILKKLLE